jgi:hypothetical protein
MATEEEIFIEWVRSRIEPRGKKSQSALARHLDLDRSQISRLLNNGRPVRVDERAKIIDFFGAQPPESDLRSVGQPGGVRVMGRVGDHLWEVDEKTRGDQRLVGSPALDYPLEEQRAFEVAAASHDGEFRLGDFIYTVSFADYRARPLQDDLVVIERKRGGLRNYSLQRVFLTKKGVELEPVLMGSSRPEKASVDQIIDLVIGSYRPRSRR